VLDARNRPELRGVDRVHQFVLRKNAAALAAVGVETRRAGTSDLVVTSSASAGTSLLKFSGNSLRLKRDWLLYHGTILYDFPAERLQRWLAEPARRPEYRGDRDHVSFVTNFPMRRDEIIRALLQAWEAHELLHDWPRRRMDELAAGRYATAAW
jgi:lipoate-protein ligase A